METRRGKFSADFGALGGSVGTPWVASSAFGKRVTLGGTVPVFAFLVRYSFMLLPGPIPPSVGSARVGVRRLHHVELHGLGGERPQLRLAATGTPPGDFEKMLGTVCFCF